MRENPNKLMHLRCGLAHRLSPTRDLESLRTYLTRCGLNVPCFPSAVQVKGLLKSTEEQQAEIARFQRNTLDMLEKLEQDEREMLRCAARRDGLPPKHKLRTPQDCFCKFLAGDSMSNCEKWQLQAEDSFKPGSLLV